MWENKAVIDKTKINPEMLYKPLNKKDATDSMNDMLRLIESFMQKSTLSNDEIEWNDILLLKIVSRIDQRSDYFTYFHSTVNENGEVELDEMSEHKKMALLCFWIIKYKPLRIKSKTTELNYYSINHCTVNEAFAAYLFISQIYNSEFIGKRQKKYYMSKKYVSDLFYKFMHHDISKEAMILSLCSIVCYK